MLNDFEIEEFLDALRRIKPRPDMPYVYSEFQEAHLHMLKQADFIPQYCFGSDIRIDGSDVLQLILWKFHHTPGGVPRTGYVPFEDHFASLQTDNPKMTGFCKWIEVFGDSGDPLDWLVKEGFITHKPDNPRDRISFNPQKQRRFLTPAGVVFFNLVAHACRAQSINFYP